MLYTSTLQTPRRNVVATIQQLKYRPFLELGKKQKANYQLKSNGVVG